MFRFPTRFPADIRVPTIGRGCGHLYGYDNNGTSNNYGYIYNPVNRFLQNYDHGRELLAALATQRKTGEFLDVVVQVEGREFPCHRAVLASTRYFKTMLSSMNLSERDSEVIQLCGIDSTSFSKILDFLYTGEICIHKDNVQNILQAAHMLQFDKIVQCCCGFIEDNLCPYNCLGVMRLADMYGVSALKKSSWDMAVSNFSDVTQEDEFVNLSVQELADLVGDQHLKANEEDTVVHSVIKWLDYAPEDRKTGILKILQEVRLSCVRVSVLEKLESHPVIQESVEYLTKVTAAREKHLLGTLRPPTDAKGDEANGSPRRGISDNLAIVVGGWKEAKKFARQEVNPMTPLQSIICCDPDSEKFYHITTLPTPVSGNMSVTSAGRHLYVTGGRVHPRVGQGPHSAPSRQAFRYEFPSDTWLRLPDMPSVRARHQSAVVDGKLFVAGGDAEVTSLVTLDCYDPEEGAWIKIRGRHSLRTSSYLKVIAFRDMLVFIVPEITNVYTLPIVGEHSISSILHAPSQGVVGLEKLCVHAIDVKTKCWRYADTPRLRLGPLNLVDLYILTTTVNNRLYIRTGYTQRSDLYIYDAEENCLTKGGEGDWEENVLRAQCEHSHRYARQEGLVDTIHHYKFGDRHISTRQAQTPFPFALFGHSFLQTKKSRVGWYCRDLAALEKNDEPASSDSGPDADYL
ncbi:PREDICTED: kelch-like protein 24 [Branchiostoma belcheri]|uniref:Kelch-like protein 24 n=1 Tax=Branchiostoma belcheri TaxID=7741 RepID=A0A6P4ZE20_BRABE|nr:PREDICTED: kelch-like protein 24 [Branchiostoma belcheri]